MNRVATLALLATLAGCMTQGGPTPRDEANRRALADARPVGEPRDCITINLMRHSVGRDDRTIDFFLADSRVMRNRLRQQCRGLADEDRFLYRTAAGQLCSSDAITVLRSDGSRGPTCALGRFQQVEIARE